MSCPLAPAWRARPTISRRKWAAPRAVCAPALPEPDHQHVAGTGDDGQQRMIAPLAGVAVVAGPILGQPVGLADGGVQVDDQRSVAGSGTSRPGPRQQFPAHPVQLADMAPPEAAQEGAQGGWRLDHAADGASGPAGAEHIGVIDAVTTGQRGGQQGQHLVARVRPPRCVSQVNVLAGEFAQTQMLGKGDRKEQPGIGHRTVVVEGNSDAVGLAG